MMMKKNKIKKESFLHLIRNQVLSRHARQSYTFFQACVTETHSSEYQTSANLLCINRLVKCRFLSHYVNNRV